MVKKDRFPNNLIKNYLISNELATLLVQLCLCNVQLKQAYKFKRSVLCAPNETCISKFHLKIELAPLFLIASFLHRAYDLPIHLAGPLMPSDKITKRQWLRPRRWRPRPTISNVTCLPRVSRIARDSLTLFFFAARYNH